MFMVLSRLGTKARNEFVVKRARKVSKTGTNEPLVKAASNGDQPKPLAKSADPAFMKFTTYIKKTTHRAVKMRMVGAEREMSELVEDLLSEWLKENDSNEH